MKANLIYFTLTAALLGAAFRLSAQGYILPNGVIYIGAVGLGYGYEIDVRHNPNSTADGSYTGFLLEPVGYTPPDNPVLNTFRFDPIVDIGVRVFLVSPNDPVSFQQIQANAYTELTFPNSYIFHDGTPVYVGLYTGNQPYALPNGIYTDPLFGWAELENVGGVIQLIDGAIEYQGGGIYAGTQNIVPVPEPSSMSLFSICVMYLCILMKRNNKHLQSTPANVPGLANCSHIHGPPDLGRKTELIERLARVALSTCERVETNFLAVAPFSQSWQPSSHPGGALRQSSQPAKVRHTVDGVKEVHPATERTI
jgi:hypothetical protein